MFWPHLFRVPELRPATLTECIPLDLLYLPILARSRYEGIKPLLLGPEVFKQKPVYAHMLIVVAFLVVKIFTLLIIASAGV